MSDIKPKKSLGQHWLVDESALESICDAAKIEQTDTVLEIGPGTGLLTKHLVKHAKRVIAVETDRALAHMLQGAVQSSKLTTVQADFMDFNLENLPAGYKVVANIPYYLTSAIIRKLLSAKNQPDVIALTIQKEVAERIVAEPGQMSVLAFSVQYVAHAELVSIVPAVLFDPVPKVDSAILTIEPYEEPLFPADEKKLYRLVKAGFGEKRKMLKNSLAGGLHINQTEAAQILKHAKIKETARAQELDFDDWERLYRVVFHDNYKSHAKNYHHTSS